MVRFWVPFQFKLSRTLCPPWLTYRPRSCLLAPLTICPVYEERCHHVWLLRNQAQSLTKCGSQGLLVAPVNGPLLDWQHRACETHPQTQRASAAAHAWRRRPTLDLGVRDSCARKGLSGPLFLLGAMRLLPSLMAGRCCEKGVFGALLSFPKAHPFQGGFSRRVLPAPSLSAFVSVPVPSLRSPRWAASPCLLAVRALSLVACLSPDGLVPRGTLGWGPFLYGGGPRGPQWWPPCHVVRRSERGPCPSRRPLLDGRPVRKPSAHPGSVGLGVGRA